MLMTQVTSAYKRLLADRSLMNVVAVSVLVAVIGMLLAPKAIAEDKPAATIDFNIPEQPVSSALRIYAHQAKMQLLVLTEGLEAIRANRVVGTYTRDDALTALLIGTGLTAQFQHDSTITVRRNDDVEEEYADARISDGRTFLPVSRRGGTSQPAEERETEEANERFDRLEQITVTGSRIRGAQPASPVVILTRQEIETAGISTVEDLFDKLPQNFGAGTGQDMRTNSLSDTGVVGGDVEALSTGTSVNLRGLGASSTLVLVNGRRISPSGRSARYTDISGIPVTAIERVEILTDGASAIYGSDAIGGVVNFILRDDYDGAETRLRYGTDDGGNTSETVIGQSLGTSWDTGNVLFSYEYYTHDKLANNDRDLASTTDLSRFGGDDRRTLGGNPANVQAGSETFAIPSDQDGTSLTPADFDLARPLNLYNSRAGADLLPHLKRHSAFLHLSQSLGSVELFSDIRFSRHQDDFRRNSGTFSITVPDTNPYFVDPTGSGLGTVTVLNYSISDDLGPEIVSSESDSLDLALGLQFSLGEAWTGELVGNRSTQNTVLRLDNIVDRIALADAVNQTDPDLAFNPFADGSNTNPAALDTLRTGEKLNDAENELSAVALNLNGTVTRIAGGDISVAAGVEFREDSLISLGESDGALLPITVGNRDVMAVYAEVFLPFISSENDRPGVRRLDLSLAARYESYSDFHSSTNPKLGLTWSPTQSITVRGTYGTSYRAPALFDLDIGSAANSFVYLPQFFVDIGLIPFPTLVLQGANERLEAEEAITWTAGFQLRPETIPALSLDFTYFNVDFDNQIDDPFVNILDGFSDPRFATLLNTSPTPEQISAVANDPRYVESVFGFTTPAADILSGAAPVEAILDRRKTNLSKSEVTGVELQLSYDIESAVGLINFGLNGNYLFDFKRQFIAGDPIVDEVDLFGRPVDFRARGHVSWTRGDWVLSGFANYIDSYTDNVNEPALAVDSWMTVDLTLSYDTRDSDTDSLLRNTRLTLSVENAFDENPPFVNTIDGLAYDTSNANALGRFLAFQLTKEW